jgi:hypothetical protein
MILNHRPCHRHTYPRDTEARRKMKIAKTTACPLVSSVCFSSMSSLPQGERAEERLLFRD